MRGDIIGVWSETWREIWTPLIEQQDVPEDVFCELYRELASALRAPTDEEAVALVVSDAIQLREAFELVPVRAKSIIELAQVKDAFDASGATDLQEPAERRAAVERALTVLIGSASRVTTLLDQVLAGLAQDPQKRAEAKERSVDAVINNLETSRYAFERLPSRAFGGERALVAFLEAAHVVLDELGGDTLSNSYFNLLTAFVDKFSLRYDLRRPCILCPTLPGVFASLVRDLSVVTSRDAHLDSLRKDFEEAIRDLRIDCADARIRNCIQKQVILLEALGQCHPGVTENTLGAICGQVGTWPHVKVQEAIKDLYKFTNSYPGIRHAGTPATALRTIDMRDLVAVSILLAGFTPYLSNAINADHVYRGI